MNARVKFGYDHRERLVKALTQEDGSLDEAAYAELAGILVPAPDKDRALTYYAWPGETLIDVEEDGPRLSARGIQFTVVAFKGTVPLQALLPGGARYDVHVQVPHVGLLAVDEAMVEEDCCTDRLQSRLDDGWRILCVCPPNAARRPDYVLGRQRKDKS